MALRKGDPAFLDGSIEFLLADVMAFGTGYTKERIWKHITRFQLDSKHIESLQAAALKYLKRPVQREFWYMCRAMSRLATAQFWQEVESTSGSADSETSQRASYLFAYSKGVDFGQQVHAAVAREWLKFKHGRY